MAHVTHNSWNVWLGDMRSQCLLKHKIKWENTHPNKPSADEDARQLLLVCACCQLPGS